MKAIWKNTVLAESDDTVVVEGNHYFPPAALHREHFRESATHSVCPWKGTASYYDVMVGGDVNRDAAWYYPSPKPAAANIAGRVAFWKGVQVFALAALVLGAGPARALEEFTGTYVGKMSCEAFESGMRSSFTTDVSVDIQDAGNGGAGLAIQGVGNMLGRYVIDAADPDRAVVQLATCEVTEIEVDGAVLHAEVRTTPGKLKASFVGTLIVMDSPADAGSICELKLKRVDETSPTPICLL
jgi:uncharacterized protein (DUF427 family)